MKRFISIVLVVLMCCFLFTGCGKDAGTATEPSVSTDGLAVNSVVSGPINPLTGETVDEDTSIMRPYCVMINNVPPARPSKGLSQASIIYEARVEGGITRLMAVFNDLSGITVGSIRSSRPYYISLAQAYDAIYVHAGGSDQAYSDLSSYGIDHLDGVASTGGAFYRDQARLNAGIATEHTMFATGDKIVAYSESNFETEHASDYDTTYGLIFSEDAAEQCTDGETTEFTVNYGGYSTTFKYDDAKGCYNPYMSGSEYADDGTISIDLKNVIILDVATRSLDAKDHQEMELTGSGDGYFVCNGKYVAIKWSRDSRDDNFTYTLADGTPLALGVGKTYICIAPLSGSGSVDW